MAVGQREQLAPHKLWPMNYLWPRRYTCGPAGMLLQKPQKSLTNIVSITNSVAQFSTLASLLSAAGLVDVLSGGSLTMFAPTNDAFAKLPGAFMEFLTRPKNKQALVRLRCRVGSWMFRVGRLREKLGIVGACWLVLLWVAWAPCCVHVTTCGPK